VTGTHTDPAERGVIEAAIQERTAQLNAILALSPDGVVAFDAQRRVISANPAFERMTGLGSDRWLGQDEARFCAELAACCVPHARFRGISTMREDPSRNGECPRELIELAAAAKRRIEVTLRVSEGAAVSQILYFRDVTREAEIDEMKSQFLATAAHELRTPMASIYGFTEVLLTQEFDEAGRRELLEIIHSRAELIALIINELLDLARIEARRGMDFVLEDTSVQELLETIVHEFKAPNGRPRPVLQMPADAVPVKVDCAKVAQAMFNVLANAFKFSPEGGEVRIEVEARSSAGRAPMAAIRVVDRGIGMSAGQQKRVFERFYRADTSGTIPGTGLGMTIVKEIIELHHGRIELESEPGHGTAVTLLLPLADVPPAS
jgi:signal transduction histidine kinase